jgi:hypothetical protein
VIALALLLVIVGGGVAYMWDSQREAATVATGTSDEGADDLVLQPVSITKTTPPREGYVGSQVCAECHQELHESFSQHPRANSMFTASEAPDNENFAEARFRAPGNREYRVERRNGRVFHHETMFDKNGKPIYDMAREVSHVLGSGRRGRSYLIEEAGYLYQSPISWYSHAEKWDLPPGYVGFDHARFWRRLGEGCFYCHAGQTALYPELDDKYPKNAFYEAAIGCERCHGPGEQHVAFRKLEMPPPDAVDPIVNPVDLEPAAAEAVCAQCHLAGESVIPRSGRRHRDFRPGQRLEDTWLIFVSANDKDEKAFTRAVSHVEQMRASTCYQSSDGAMNCVTCHDPHSTPEPENRELFYNARCATCHGELGCSLPDAERLAEPAAGSCIACHMPRFPTNDIPHTAGSDHRILRISEAQERQQPTLEQILNPQVFDAADQRLPQREVDRGVGMALVEQPVVQNDGNLLANALDLILANANTSGPPTPSAILEMIGNDVPALKKVGGVFQLHSDLARANACWNRILQLSPHDEDAHWWLMLNERQQGNLDEAARHLRHVLAVNPLDPLVHEQKALLLEQFGDLKGAIEAAEVALKYDPARISVRQWLVQACESAGLPDKREEHMSVLQRMSEVLQDAR